MTVYEVLEKSRNNPDNGPNNPHKRGMWVWWRTGPHPQGVWQAMDISSGSPDLEAWQENEWLHPITQDSALGDYGDRGHVSCHACGELSKGYPEPRHKTLCDGVCKRIGCTKHAVREPEPEPALSGELVEETKQLLSIAWRGVCSGDENDVDDARIALLLVLRSMNLNPSDLPPADRAELLRIFNERADRGEV